MIAGAAALLASSAALSQTSPQQTSELFPPPGTVGIVRLSSIFREDVCAPFEARPIPLFDRAKGLQAIGKIEVDGAHVGAKDECVASDVRVQMIGAGSGQALPTLEYAYEMPAAIVLAMSDGWCQIKLASGKAWMHDGCESGFESVESLLRDKMLYLVEGAMSRACLSPGGKNCGAVRSTVDVHRATAELLDMSRVDRETWIRVSIKSGGDCDPSATGETAMTVWLPLRDRNGRLQVWFYSRGC